MQATQLLTKPVPVGATLIGGKELILMAGPCAVESVAQIQACASFSKEQHVQILRGGAFKPRTNPRDFQGLGLQGLTWLIEAARQVQLPVVTELLDVRHLDTYLEYGVDMIQVGSRNMQNFELLKALGETRVPVLLKRGMSATIKEWLLAAEYIVQGGNEHIILCERGVRTFESSYRNMLDITAIPYLKQTCPFPVIVDPSHASGQASLVSPLAKAAIAAGADGLLIEMHPTPTQALSDADQALTFTVFKELCETLRPVAAAVDRILR